MRKSVITVCLLACISTISGCAAHKDNLPTIGMVEMENSYTLGSGDKLRITVYGEEKLTGEYLVDGSGAISFPLIGGVEAKGISATALALRITEALRKGYIDEPSVTIDILDLRPYYILGEVNKPGEYPYSDGLSIFSAVAKAEGFTYRADNKRVLVRHKSGREEVLYKLDGTSPIRPGDTVRILERKF